MTCSLPGLLCLSFLPSQRLFLLHSKYVCPLSFLLILTLSHLSPVCTQRSFPLCPNTHPCWAPGSGTEQPLLSSRASYSWCLVRSLLSSALTSPPFIPAGPATCPGSQGKDPELACSRLGQACWGTRDRGQALGKGANLQFPRIP